MNCTIDRIEIVSFGKLQNAVFTLSEGLNVLTAPNESGKSTLAAFLRFVFYGFTDARKKELYENDKKLYTPWDASKCEGSVTVSRGGRQYRAFRSIAGNKEICTLTEVATGRRMPDENAPGVFLFGVSEEVFGRTLFFKQLTVPTGRDGVMAEQLQNIAVSADEQVGSRRAVERLTKAKNELKGRGNSGIIPRIETEIARQSDALYGAKKAHEEIDALRAEQQKQQNLLAENAASQERVRDELQNISRFEAAKKLAQLETLQKECGNARQACETANAACKGATHAELQELHELYLSCEKASSRAEAAYDALQKAPVPETPQAPRTKTGMLPLIAGVCLLAAGIALLFVFLPVGVVSAVLGASLAVFGIVSKNKQKQALDARRHTARQAALDEQNALELVYAQAKEHADALRGTLETRLKPYGVTEYGDAASAILALQNACRERDRLQAAAESASRAAQIALDGVDMPALQALATDAREPIRDRSSAERELHFLTEQARMIGDRAASTSNRIAALEASTADISLLESKLDALQRALAEAKQKYDAYEEARAGIEEASDEMKRMVVPRLGEIAGKYFAAATGGTYGGMEVDTRLAMTVRDRDGIVRETDYLSAGTRDIAYLALRLALAELLYGSTGMPFVWDDAFGRLDDTRLMHVLRVLYAASQKHQTLLLCCTDREETLLSKEHLTYTSVDWE